MLYNFYLSSYLGTPFDCLFDILPIKNDDDKVVMFVASHKDLSGQSFDESGKKWLFAHQLCMLVSLQLTVV